MENSSTHLHRHLGDIGDPPPHRPPLDTDSPSELVAELGLVQVADRLRPVVERSGVEGGPPPVGPVDEVGDHHVCVQVGIAEREVR